jgi:hypothetical protein
VTFDPAVFVTFPVVLFQRFRARWVAGMAALPGASL